MKLLRSLILRPLRRDLPRTLLTVLSVALGVAVVVAIDLAGDAATGSFRSSMETLAGKTDLEIAANGGVDERFVAALAALPVDARFSPVIESQAEIAGIGSVALYGLDLVNLAGAPHGVPRVAVSEALARTLPGPTRAAPGSALTLDLAGHPLRCEVAQVTAAGSAEFVAMDIADAQQALGRYGKLDRIDAAAAPGQDFPALEAAVRQALPASYLITRPGARNQENQRMLRAFRWNLRVLSYISLVVGAFLIYNTISISVVRRRAEIGILRATGAARWMVLWLFLAEALLFGVVGGALGVALGRILAGATVQLIAGTVNALYTTSRPAAVELTWAETCLGIATGAAVALFSAFAPAREAMQVSPTEAMSRGAHEHRARLSWRRGLAWSAAFAASAWAASLAPPLGGYPVGGYVAALLAVAAAATATPATTVLVVATAARTLGSRNAEALLAARSLESSLARTSVVVAALATAIAMMTSVGIMVGSFRETVTLWLDVQLRADLYVRAAAPAGAGINPPLPAEVGGILQSTPGVAAVDLFHALELHYRGDRATLGAGNLDVVRRYGRLRFLPGQGRDAILRSLSAGAARAIVSEPFANKHGVHAGDRLSVPIAGQLVTLTVAGVYYEYSSSQGYVIVDNSTLQRYLPGQPATNAAVYLNPGADAGAVRRQIQLRTAGMGVAVAPNSELRRAAIAIFDRTFAITWALEAVALVVAMLGAANSLLALVLDRRREIGLLRYLGASPAQIRGMILTEAGFLGLLAAILGLALGFALSLVLIFVVNRQSFGWTIQFHPPVALLAAALAAVWLVTVAAALYPARVAARLIPADVVHEE
jgi:putative ABC transport system permease protein